MRVSLDGGVTWIDAPEGVKVDVDLLDGDNEPGSCPSIQFNFSEEGLIADLWAAGDVGECEETIAVPIDCLSDHLFGVTL